MSAMMSDVEQYTNPMFFCSICSRIKWCAMSMCFVRLWLVGLFANAIVDWLSCWIGVIFCLKPISSNRCRIHNASFVALERAWYSAWVEDVATDDCLCVCQDTTLRLIAKMYSVVERLSFKSPPQSALQEPVSSILESLFPLLNCDWPRVSAMLVVPEGIEIYV